MAAARSSWALLCFLLTFVLALLRPGKPEPPDRLPPIPALPRWLLQRRHLKHRGRGDQYAGMIIGYRRDGRPVRLMFGGAGPALVQVKGNTGGSVSTVTVTLSATGAGNTLIAAIGDNGTSSALYATSVKTGGGTSFTARVQVTDSAGSCAEIWSLDNIASGQTSAVLTLPSSGLTHIGMVVYEISGLQSSGSFDKSSSASADGASPTTWTSGSSGTLSQASEIAIGASSQQGVSVVTTGPSSPWINSVLGISSGAGVEAGYNIVSATTAQTYAGTNTHSGTGHTATCIATFKASTTSTQNVTMSLSGTGTAAFGGRNVPALSLSGTGTPAFGPVLQPAAAWSGSGTWSAAGTQEPGLSASGTGTFSTAVTQEPGLAGTGTGTASFGGAVPGAAAWSGSGAPAFGPVLAGAAAWSGTGAWSAAVTQKPGAAWSGTGTATAGVTQEPGLSAAGTGTASLGVTLEPTAAWSGTGLFSVAETQEPGAAWAGTGTWSAAVTQKPGAAWSGTGSWAMAAATEPGIAAAGSGTASIAVTQEPGASWSGTGTFFAEPGGAALFLSGSGTWSAGVTTEPGIAASGSGAAVLGAAFGGAAAWSGSGTAAFGAGWAGGISASGTGLFKTGVTQEPGIAAAGSGTFSAGATRKPTAAWSGSGALSAGVTQGPGLSGTGLGLATIGPAELVQLAAMSLAGTGVFTAGWTELITVTDSDHCYAVESGFNFITDSDTCHGTDGGELLLLADTEVCYGTDFAVTAWPSDTDACSAAEHELTAWPSDTETCQAAEASQLVLQDAEVCAAVDAVGPDIEIYTFVPPQRTGPGGGWYSVTWGGHEVLRIGRMDGTVLRFARELASAREVRFVSDSDQCSAADAARPVTAVAVAVGPPLEASVQVRVVASRGGQPVSSGQVAVEFWPPGQNPADGERPYYRALCEFDPGSRKWVVQVSTVGWPSGQWLVRGVVTEQDSEVCGWARSLVGAR